MKNLFLLIGILFISAQVSAIEFKGKIDSAYNSKTDNVYVGIVWHCDDGPNFSPSYSKTIGTVSKGKFKIEITDLPDERSIAKMDHSELSVGFIFLFKDRDNDKQFSKKDELLGISERNCLVYLKGDLSKDLDILEVSKKTTINTGRKLIPGLYLCKVVKPEKHGLEDKFDDLVPTKKKKVKISTVKNGIKPRTPNWT